MTALPSLFRFLRYYLILALILGLASYGFSFVPGPVVAHTDVSFGPHERQAVDIYYPDKPENLDEPVDVFLFIHGGSWVAGTKEEYRMFAVPMAKEGYIAATTAYRLKPDASCADMMEDIGLAIAAIKDTAEADGIAVGKLAILGDSAGAHLALLYSYTHLNGTANAPAIPLAFCIGRVAPTIVTFPGDNSMDANVINALAAAGTAAPPTILCYAGQDELVNMERHGLPLQEKLRELSVPFEWFFFPNSGHSMLSPLDFPMHKQSMDAFFAYADLYF